MFLLATVGESMTSMKSVLMIYEKRFTKDNLHKTINKWECR